MPALRLYSSTAIEGDIAAVMGMAHYSYHFAQQHFEAMLTRHGYEATLLRMPEYYGSPAALPDPRPGPPLHLIFRSTEQIRLLKHATNICCFAWEFPLLKTETLADEHPFLNQARMLGLCDEVWTPSHYALNVLRAHGVPNTHRIPAPVAAISSRANRREALAGLGAIETIPLRTHFLLAHYRRAAWCAEGALPLADWLARHTSAAGPPTIYLSILNPTDHRKNIDAMLRGFHHFQRLHGNAVLIVKVLTARSRFSLVEVASNLVPHMLAAGTALANDAIVFINPFLSEAEMSLLYSLADFYLCTSLAEGQNLPLLEAMAHGTVPVSTANTAMADYIDPGCGFVIAERSVDNDNVNLAGTIAGRPFSISRCTARDVFETLCAAQRSNPRARATRAAAARQTVESLFGQAAVWSLMLPRLAAVAARAAR